MSTSSLALAFGLPFFASFLTSLLIIKSNKLHAHISRDLFENGGQKQSLTPIPRIGGISVAIGISLGALLLHQLQIYSAEFNLLVISAIPIFFIGLAEDLSKNIRIKIRIIFIVLGALLANQLLNLEIDRIGLPPLDELLSTAPFFLQLFTLFAITGLVNSFNIIDGVNGLSSMAGIISLSSLLIIGYSLNDILVIYLSLIMIAAILGFFFWNYPSGSIFLGDGGAYLIGFWNAAICIFLITRNHQVSPWFIILINFYPIFETLFTIYRRQIHQKKSPAIADRVHFHTLIFRRIAMPTLTKDKSFSKNSKTAPYLWVLCISSNVLAIIFWQSTLTLITCTLLFSIAYCWLYNKIIKFQTPSWM